MGEGFKSVSQQVLYDMLSLCLLHEKEQLIDFLEFNKIKVTIEPGELQSINRHNWTPHHVGSLR